MGKPLKNWREDWWGEALDFTLGGDGEPGRVWERQRGTGKAESWEWDSDSTMLGQIGVRRDVEGTAMTTG